MRFDYIPPFTYYRLFNIRKYYTIFLTSSGLLCIFIALFANKPVLETIAEPNIQRLTIPASVNIDINQPTDIQADNQTDNYNKVLALKPEEDKWQVIAVKQGDTLSKIFNDLQLSNYVLLDILTNNPEGGQLSNLSPGQKIKFLISKDKELKAIKVPRSDTKTLLIKSSRNGYRYIYNTKEIIKKFAYCSNVIKDSLFLAGQTVGLSDKTIMELVDIFGWDIDFRSDIRENDHFKILFEEDYIGTKKIRTGDILMAEFTNQNRTYKAIKFTEPNGHSGYYTPEGYSVQKAFLRTPLKFTRISSRFSTARQHPILHKIRAHKGVDYAAPRGTPVKAAGDGKIIFIGNQNGYGKTLEIQHGRKYSTLYAHLSKFSPNLKQGNYVKQGQVIGFVGRTGLASGDHLHYEFRVNGIHRDPLSVTLPKSLPIADKYKEDFFKHVQQVTALITEHTTNHVATNG